MPMGSGPSALSTARSPGRNAADSAIGSALGHGDVEHVQLVIAGADVAIRDRSESCDWRNGPRRAPRLQGQGADQQPDAPARASSAGRQGSVRGLDMQNLPAACGWRPEGWWPRVSAPNPRRRPPPCGSRSSVAGRFRTGSSETFSCTNPARRGAFPVFLPASRSCRAARSPSSLPCSSSAYGSSLPPTCWPLMKICGHRPPAPARWVIATRIAGSRLTSVS